MAIGTAEKRKSISGIWVLIPGVTPNALKDAEWRQQSAWGYSGIAVSPFVSAGSQEFEAFLYPRDFTAKLYKRDFEAALHPRDFEAEVRLT